MIEGIANSRYLDLHPPDGAMYAFPSVNRELIAGFSDREFALELLEKKHVLIAPGTSFNVPYQNHFRITTLPDEREIKMVFERMEEVLDLIAS